MFRRFQQDALCRPRCALHAVTIAVVLLLAFAPHAQALAAGTGTDAGTWSEAAQQWLMRIPLWAYLLSFLVLPAFGFPLTLYYLTIGVVADGLVPALLLTWACMAGNMALSYVVARAGAEPVRALVERLDYRVPRVRRRNEWKLIVALRASPLPWLMQSWLLALGGARFVPYMLFGVPVQALVALGFVVLSESLLAGDTGWALLGLSLLLVIGLALPRLWRSARRAEPELSAVPEET